MDALRELTVAFDEADDRALVGGVACGISVVCKDLNSTACQAVCPIRPTGSTAEPQHYSHPLLFTAQWLRSASPAMTARSRTAAYNIAHNSFAHRMRATHARLWPSAVAHNAQCTASCGESESTAQPPAHRLAAFSERTEGTVSTAESVAHGPRGCGCDRARSSSSRRCRRAPSAGRRSGMAAERCLRPFVAHALAHCTALHCTALHCTTLHSRSEFDAN